MSSPPVTCELEADMRVAMNLMMSNGFRHLPVVDGKALAGILSIRDCLAMELRDKQLEAAVLRDNVIAVRHAR
jgi:signal-transduction protein with cAMP-binding, CBS, and nucleotidyltransferase domain